MAQKGMKFDLISDDFNTLKLLSQRNKKSVPEFLEDLKTKDYNNRVNELLEKCGGDEALARHIIDLENSGTHEALNGFCELQSFFKDIKTPDDLPIEVREAAELKGRLLLDEYLRYLLNQKRKKEAFIKANIFSKESSIGSQQSRKDNITPEATEFLRGLWK